MKLSPRQRDVLERAACGADIIVPNDKASTVVQWTDEYGNCKVRWNVFQALLRRGCIESYKRSSLGTHYRIDSWGRAALAASSAPTRQAVAKGAGK